MHIVRSTNEKSKVLVIGDSVITPDMNPVVPFDSEAGNSILKPLMMVAGVYPHYMDIKKDDYDQEMTPEVLAEVFAYISANDIKQVITLGRWSTQSLFPSAIKKQTMAWLTSIPMFEPMELQGIKLGVMYSPMQVLKSNDPQAAEEWSTRLEKLFTVTDEVVVNVKHIETEDEFIELLNHLDSFPVGRQRGLDYETNAVDAFNVDHYITMIGLSVLISPTEANAWYWVPPRKMSDRVLEAFTNFLVKWKNDIWAYNVTFEMKVTWHATGKYVEMQDALVLATCLAKRGSLKDNVRAEFGAGLWEAPVHAFKAKSGELFKIVMAAKPIKLDADNIINLKDLCRIGDLNGLYSYGSPAIKGILDWMLEGYSREEVQEVITHYPYEWGGIPKQLLGIYCAYDAGYTVLLANKMYIPEMEFAYQVYIRHPYLATKFEVNGILWDDKRATDLETDTYTIMLKLLHDIIQDCDIPLEKKLEATDILNRPLPYTVTWYTEKTRAERQYVVATVGQKIEELKGIFNPGSNTDATRDKFWNPYLTDEIQLGTVLLLFLEDIELKGLLPDLYVALGDKSFIYQNKPAVVMEAILGVTQQNNALGKGVQQSLNFAVNTLPENIRRFAGPVVKFQYKMHNTFLKLNPDDESTWSKEFRMLFNIFYYKKLNKMVSTNVNGTTGRSACHQIVGTLHGKPLRGANYWDLVEQKVDMSSVQLILNTDFNTLSAATTRWSAGFHTVPASSPARKCFTVPEDEIWVHADYSQAELVLLAFLSGDPTMIQAFLDGKDMHQFMASKVFEVDYDQVSKDQRKYTKTINFGIVYGKSVENIAIEITGGDVAKAQNLFDTIFRTFPGVEIWMNEKKKEVDDFGYVTTLFGNRLLIDVNEPGNGRYRKGVNAPLQGGASTIAGTSIESFSSSCDKDGIPEHSMGFTHDAMDSASKIDYVFPYIDLMVQRLQTDLREKMGIPMSIDYELGANAYNICHWHEINQEGDVKTIHIEGENESTELLIKKLDKSTTYKVLSSEVIKSKSEATSWAEMFTTGTALKDSWGKTVTKNTVELKVQMLPQTCM
ncbi:DNA polymerase I [Ralstonia phage RP13]|nr:DNA polymerase I [Ralstonia phage RP13]